MVKFRKHDYNHELHSWVFLSPSLIGVVIFYILPFFLIIYYAFVDNPVSTNFVFLDNFKALLNNESFKKAVKNTLTFTGTAVPLAMVLALLLAIVFEEEIFLKSQFRTIFLTPMMVPAASIVLIWQVFFHNNGAVNEFLSVFGFKIDWFTSDYSQVIIIILFVWKNLGYNMILFMAALGDIPKEVIESAYVDGASSVKCFFKIKLYYLSSTILFAAILSIINSFKIFREVYLLTGDHPYGKLYTLQHFMNNLFRNLDYQKISSAAILMSIAMIIFIAILYMIENKFGKEVES